MTPRRTSRRALFATGALLAGASLLAVGCATAPGPRVAVVDIRLPLEAGRHLPLRVLYPGSGRRLPVVLFSHGAYSSGQDYDALLRAWAADGYVVLAPTHRDSIRLGVTRGSNDPRFFAWRLDDMEAIATRLAAVRAVIIFSGAGVMEPLLRADDFSTLSLPTLVTVGSEDLAQAPGLTGYAWRRQPFDLIPPDDKYLLTLEGADHYLGGAVGRDDLPRSPNAARYIDAFNDTCARFLARYLRDGRASTAPLAAPLEPLARLDWR